MKPHHKIKTVDEIKAIIGPFGHRGHKVCMCHGTFDIVHPGHIRHLIYAKEHADILIASLTADAHVSKGAHKPEITQEWRALNLAVYEMVDYVVIDNAATPLGNLAELKPDFFAKGFEYAGSNPNTEKEAAVVEGYGGKMLFSPGDFVRSSSAILAKYVPNLAIDTLATTMDAHGLSFSELYAALEAIKGLKVHVIGDTIVDSITETSVIGISNKTPTPSVHVLGRQDYIGGAAIVAQHLQAAGARVTLSSVIGDDILGAFVANQMRGTGIDFWPIFDDRPTTNKNAIVAGGYRLLKMDTVDNRPLSDRASKKLHHQAGNIAADVTVFSDFRHGVFTRSSIPDLADAIPAKAFRAADSQVASRWGNILDFSGFDLITPNEKEARFALGDQDSVVRPLVSKLYAESGCRTLILKMGERGVLTQAAPLGADKYLHTVGSFAREIVDAVGAGDALLAYASLSIKATGNPLIGSVLGSIAAGLECEIDGNLPVSSGEVRERLERIQRELS